MTFSLQKNAYRYVVTVVRFGIPVYARAFKSERQAVKIARYQQETTPQPCHVSVTMEIVNSSSVRGVAL